MHQGLQTVFETAYNAINIVVVLDYVESIKINVFLSNIFCTGDIFPLFCMPVDKRYIFSIFNS